MRNKLLAIDPGKLTGVAVIDITDVEKPTVDFTAEMTVDQFSDYIELYLFENKDTVRVVIERFIITVATAKKSPQPYSMELIGVVKFLCRKYEIPIWLQNPDERKFADNTKLKKVNFWHVAGEGHALDALRHALVWIKDHYPKFARSLV